MKSKVYNFVENCRNVNYNIKYEILSHKTIDKIKEATLDELLNVKEMDSKSAQSVYDYFRRNSNV